MSSKTIRLAFTYTEDEYASASRLFLRHSYDLLGRTIVTAALLALIVILISFLLGDYPLWASVALIALFEATLFWTILINAPRKYFRGDLRLHDQHEMVFTDEGVAIKSEQIDSKIGWRLYTKVIEGEKFFCLVYGNGIRTGTIVPKRAFHNSLDQDAFREMLARHIPKGLEAKDRVADQLQEREYVPSSSGPPDWR